MGKGLIIITIAIVKLKIVWENLSKVKFSSQLGVFESKEGQLLTCHLICEHGEKLKAAIALCKVDKK